MSGAAARPRTKPSPSGEGRARVPQPLWSGRTDDGPTLTPTLSRRERENISRLFALSSRYRIPATAAW
jgi:hypothetical protein